MAIDLTAAVAASAAHVVAFVGAYLDRSSLRRGTLPLRPSWKEEVVLVFVAVEQELPATLLEIPFATA